MSEYYVAGSYASTEPLIEPDSYVNTRIQFLLRAIRNNESIAKNILAARFAGINAASEKYYECGTDGSCYPISPPSILYTSLADKTNILTWARTQQSKSAAVFNKYFVGPLNLQFYSEWWLFNYYTDAAGNPWHPYRAKIAIPDPEEIAPYIEVDNLPYHDLNEFARSGVYVDYGIDPETGETLRYQLSELPDLGFINFNTIYYMFTLEDPPPGPPKTESDYVYYELLSQEVALGIPEFRITRTTETYMPVVVIMRDEQYYTAFDGLERPTHKILKKLNLDAEDIAQACRDVEIENPDIKKTDFFISYGLEAVLDTGYVITNTKVNNAHWQYLWEFFKFWSEHGAQDQTTYEESLSNDYPTLSELSLICWGEDSFYMKLSVNYIQKDTSSSYPSTITNRIYKLLEDGTYEGYHINGLDAIYWINVSRGFKAAIQNPPLVPISWRLLDNLESDSKERVLQMSVRATLFLVEERVEEVPWYKETIFGFMFLAIALVVIVWTQQYQFIPALAAAIGIPIYLATMIVNVIIGILLSLASPVLPTEIAMVLTIALTIYTLGANAGWNWASLWKGFTLKTLASVTELLKSVSDIYGFAKQYSFQDDYQQMMWEYEREAQSYREQQQELEDAYYDLANPSNINPWDLIQSSGSYVAESSEEFLARTSWRNAGSESFAMMENFFKMALTLPKKPGQGNPLMLINGFSELA